MGLPENVENGVSGFVVPRRDPFATAQKLSLLVKSPELRMQMGKAGRERVLTQFQLKDQITRFENFYTRISIQT